MIDIREGDILVVATKEYPIKSAAEWTGRGGATLGFKRLAKLTATTKRAQTSGGKIASSSAYLSGLKCTPLDPVSADLAASVGLQTPHELKQCFVGDATGFLHLVIEDLKR